MSQGAARKHLPEPVVWDQAAILSAITRLTSGVAQLNNIVGLPSSDSRGVVTRNIRDYEIIAAIKENTGVLARISEQLEILS